MILREALALVLLAACGTAQTRLPRGVLRYDQQSNAAPSLWQYIQHEWGWVVSNRPFGRSIAFLVGVGNYQYIEPNLRYVADDLKEMREFLLGPAGFDTVYVLQDAADVNLVEEFMSNGFPTPLRQEDRLLFYFTGHGVDRFGTGYMQFAKAQPNRFDVNQYLDVTRCERWSRQIPAKHILFIIDACNSGLGYDAKPGSEPRVDEDLLSLFSGDGSRVVMTAGTGNEKSFQVSEGNDRGYSVFTRAFLDAIRHTRSSSGFLILDEVMAGLRRNVATFSRANAGRQMTPRLWQIPRAPGKDKGTFVFLNPNAKAPPVPSPLKQYVKVTPKERESPPTDVEIATKRVLAGEESARKQANKALARQLASRSVAVFGERYSEPHEEQVKRERALLLATLSLRLYPTAEGDHALRQTLPLLARTHPLLFKGTSIKAHALSPTGAQLAAADINGNFSIVDLHSGREILRLPLDAGIIKMCFSPNGRWIATASLDRSARVLDAKTGQVQARLPHREEITTLVFSPDSSRLAFGDEKGAVRIVSSQGWQTVTQFGNGAAVVALGFGADNQRIAVGFRDNLSKVCDASTGKEIATVPGVDRLLAVALIGEGHLLVTANEFSVRVFDVASAKIFRSLPSNNQAFSASFSPDGSRVASVVKVDRFQLGRVLYPTLRIQVADVFSSQALSTLETPSFADLTFSADGNWIAAGGFGIRVFGAPDGKPIAHVGPQDSVIVANSPLAERVVIIKYPERTTKVLESRSGKLVATLSQVSGEKAAFEPRTNRLALGDRVYDLSTGASVYRLQDGFGPLAFSRDGQWLAVNSPPPWQVIIFSAISGSITSRFPHSGYVRGADFSSSGQLLATGTGGSYPDGTDYGSTQMFDLRSAKSIFQQSGHSAIVNGIAFSPDGKWLAEATENIARVVEVNSGKQLERMQHSSTVLSVCFSPDGRWLVSRTAQSVHVWDTETGEEWTAIPTSVISSSFSSDGRHLDVLERSENWIGYKRHPFAPQELVDEACSKVDRNLTVAEWTRYAGKDVPYQKSCDSLPLPGMPLPK